MTTMTRMDFVASVRARIGWKALTADEYQDDGYAFLSTPNIKTREIDFANVNFISPFRYDESPELKLQVGDVLLAKDGSTLGIANTVRSLPRPATVNGSIAVIRPFAVEPRFLTYWLQGSIIQGRIQQLKDGMGVPHLFQADIRKLPVPAFDMPEQRRIADFLDDRVARIDQIIAARRQQESLLRAHEESALEHLVTAGGVRRPLQSVTDPRRPIQYGIVLPGPDFDGGVPIIKGGDIGSGRLERLDLNRTDPEIERSYVRSRVRTGDLVIAIRGSVGEVAVVPEGLLIANLTQDSARIAPFGCDQAWLRATLESPGVQARMAARVTGSTVKGINIEDLRKVPIDVPSLESQRHIGAKADALRDALQTHRRGLGRSISLMQEYKQSLVTAAVTGELNVTTAGSGIPG